MADPIEEWRDVVVEDMPKNPKTMYEVSNLGNVRNKKTGRILKPSTSEGGYKQVGIFNKSKAVHRLVALAFIPNPENKGAVNHISKNTSDNRVCNLEWTTTAENNAHKLLTLEVTTNQFKAVNRIDATTGGILQTYPSIIEAAEWVLQNKLAKNLHTSRTGISACLRGTYKISHTYKWAYVPTPDLEGEEWRPMMIDGKVVDGYMVSNLARIRNGRGAIYENHKPHHSGYITIHVQYKKYALHRLVAMAFIPNPLNKPAVNHIDGNKTNNNVTNLEWVTIAENNKHNSTAGLTKFFTRGVIQYDLNMNEIARFDSIVGAAKVIGCHPSNIKAVLYNNQTSSKGFIFRYIEDDAPASAAISATASAI